MSELRFRDLHTADEFRQVMALEQEVWGFTDLNDMVTVPVFTITTKRGAILIGAFDAAERMVGFVYSIVGMKARQVLQWSHMLGVLAEYRNSGLGRDLKLAQRERALAQGYELIEWTFDPLQALNAHLNFTKLGVVAEEYHRNVYGESTSVLHRGTPTDRLVAQWWIGRPHVERRVAPAGPLAAAIGRARRRRAGQRHPTRRGLAGQRHRATGRATSAGWCSRFRWASPTCSGTRRSWRSTGGCGPARSSRPTSPAATGWWTSSSIGRPDAAATCSPRLRPTPPPDDARLNKPAPTPVSPHGSAGATLTVRPSPEVPDELVDR